MRLLIYSRNFSTKFTCQLAFLAFYDVRIRIRLLFFFFAYLLQLILLSVAMVTLSDRSSTVTIVNGKNVYYSVLGKYQNCTDPAATTLAPSTLPLCNATTTVLATTPSGFTTPYTEPTTAGGSQVSPLGGVRIVCLVIMHGVTMAILAE